jgi:hypothetical protein
VTSLKLNPLRQPTNKIREIKNKKKNKKRKRRKRK